VYLHLYFDIRHHHILTLNFSLTNHYQYFMDTEQLLNIAEVEVSYTSRYPPEERPTIRLSADAFNILKQVWNDKTIEYQEEFWILLLNRSKHVLGAYQLSKGGICGVTVDIRIIFTVALQSSSCCILLAHNHPSGQLNPSQADIELTKRISRAGDILDIKVLDHIILTRDHYYSFTDEGLL